MSEANVEVVRKALEAYNARGVEATLPFHTPDVVTFPVSDWVEDPVYHGHDGVRRVDAIWAQNFDDFALELHEVRDLDDRVLVLFEMTGRMKATGAAIRQPLGAVVSDFRDGRFGEVRYFGTWQDALKAVGLKQ